MTLLCVPITVEDADSALRDAEQARTAGADLVEFRIDGVFHGAGDAEGERAALRLCAESPLPCIITCRHASEGGDYDGDDDARIALYEKLATSDHPPRYLDLELAAYGRSANLRQKIHLAVDHPGQQRPNMPSLILSSHDFNGRPADLLRRVESMRSHEPAKVIKIAYRARSIRDNLECFEILAARTRPTIALAMGEFGVMSRILAPKFGGFLTFASLRDEAATAPGQPTIDDLLSLYRFRTINAETAVYGVIGYPVAHSLSPKVHNAAFAKAGMNAAYVPLPIPPEWEHFKASLSAFTDPANKLNFRGASVTLPHKTHLVRYAAEHAAEGWTIHESAARCGAANTLAFTGTKSSPRWEISNTDGIAVAECLAEKLGDLKGRRIVILGAGGAARAAAAELAARGASLVIANRTHDKAVALAEKLAPIAHAAGGAITPAASPDALDLSRADAVVNCTPIGMAGGPAPNESPLTDEVMATAGPGMVVFDTVYAAEPPATETVLIRQANKRESPTVEGMAMFLRQAESQCAIWRSGTDSLASIGGLP